MLKHCISTYPGNSGSPILSKREGKIVAAAIHKGSHFSKQFNVARIITSDLLANVLAWKEEMN